MMQANNLIGGRILRGKIIRKNISPIDGSEASKAGFLTIQETENVFRQAKNIRETKSKNSFSELSKLAKFFKKNHLRLTNQIMNDAGFIRQDSEDLVDASIEFCEDYHLHIKEISNGDSTTSFSFAEGSVRKVTLTSSPYGLLAATTPRNTPLITELTVIVHALWSGNTLVLRPSIGVAGVIALLVEGLQNSFEVKTLQKLYIIFTDAKNFVSISLDYADLLHYIGSTKYLENTLVAGITKGVKVLADGDGCSLLIVDSTANIEEAAKTSYQGLIRCNGQICISVRVIAIEQSVYEEFLSHFLELIKNTTVIPPELNNQSNMGPLFSQDQAEAIISIEEKYQSLYADKNPLKFGPNYISPVVVKLEPDNNTFLEENLFGPIVGVTHFKKDGWKRWLTENPINLTDVVFSKNKEFVENFLATSKAPRKLVNLDPTLESVFEPWGAFLPSGWNDVSQWYNKYRKQYQLMKG